MVPKRGRTGHGVVDLCRVGELLENVAREALIGFCQGFLYLIFNSGIRNVSSVARFGRQLRLFSPWL